MGALEGRVVGCRRGCCLVGRGGEGEVVNVRWFVRGCVYEGVTVPVKL